MIEEWVEWGLNEINECCLFIRDSSRLFHSDLILTSFLCHSINIYIRSCPEWYWNERMIEEWIKWGLNEINGCCLFIRDSSHLFHSYLILLIPESFRHYISIPMSSNHSYVIPPFLHSYVTHHSIVIPSFLGHSVIISSFLCDPINPMSFNHSNVSSSFPGHSVI